MKTKIFFLLMLSVFAIPGRADSGGSSSEGSFNISGTLNLQKKAEAKESSRWTLSEWLAQKDRNRSMDMWLSMHSESPYEGFIAAYYQDYTLAVDNPVTSMKSFDVNGSAGFYALILGIEGFYQNNWQESYVESGALVSLRVLGHHVQNTHLLLQYGTQSRKSATFNYNQNFAGADVDLYVERHSGLHGNYRYYFPANDSVLGSVNESRWEAGVFWDISFIKLMAGWSSDLQTTSLNSVNVNRTRTGVYSGVKLFF